MNHGDASIERTRLVRRGLWLSRMSLAYNSLEGIASVVAGIAAGSISLVGFGLDSAIESVSSVASLWRLHSDRDPVSRARSERITLRIVGASFIGLSLYIIADAGRSFIRRDPPEQTIPGVVIAALSVVIMPILARQKRVVAKGLGSRALEADAKQTDLCVYLSWIVLGGVSLNTLFGWWWADPLAALVMVPIIAREGIEGLRGESSCDCD